MQWKKLAFAATAVVLCTLGIELMLWVLTLVSPQVRLVLSSPWDPSLSAPTIPDARLGYRPNPALRDHDRHGFRNPSVPKTAQVVALGDSQTYGTGVAAERAWPRQLEALSGRTVYSMAYGGYGPVHSLLLWDEAMALKPAVVIEALYAGNDLFDCFDIVYNQGQLADLRSRDPARIAAVREAEQSEPIVQRVNHMFNLGAQPSLQPTNAAAAAESTAQGSSLRSWIGSHSRIFGLLRRALYVLANLRKTSPRNVQVEWQKAQALAQKNARCCQVFADDSARTVFTAEYRLAALDLKDPRIEEGQRIALDVLRRMDERARRDGVHFVVLMLPTKELVFLERANGIDAPSYRALVAMEQRFWERAQAFLSEHAIDSIDALTPLREQLTRGPQPYPVTTDGHPTEDGHRAIARAVQAHLDARDRSSRDQR